MKKVFVLLFVLVVSNLFALEALQNAKIPKDTKSDWMELKSGEWIRGEFKGVYSGKVEFDSEEFNLVKFDPNDVKQIKTRGTATLNLNREIPSLSMESLKINPLDINPLDVLDSSANEVTGNLSYKDGKFYILLEDGVLKSVSPEDIASISSGELKESNYWSASLFLGIDVMSGNSKQITVTSKASAQRRTHLTRFRADYVGTYTNVDSNRTTADNNNLTSSFDLYQTRHFYWRLAGFQFVRDPFKNIESKYTLSAGLGYDVLYTNTTDWSITVGPGYQVTNYDKVEVGADKNPSTALLFFDTRFKEKITGDVDFLVNYNMYLVNSASGDYIHHLEVSLETEIVNDFTFDVSFFWDRVESPIAFTDGSVPGQDDFKTMLAIGYSY